MFNKVVLVGNLTRDIELRYIQSGTAVGSTGMAVNRKFNVNGERRDETCFIDITFFGRQAEVANQYLNKGSKVLIEGRLKFDTWQDQNGQNRSKHSVVVENMEMLGGQQNQGGFIKDGNEPNYANNGYSTNMYNQNREYNQNSGGFNREFNQNNNYSQNRSYNQKQMDSEPYQEKVPEIDIDADIKYDNKPTKSNFDSGTENEEIPF
ncbi:single-stranded DNA-binding protein [Campylobacter porcelli]|uniref:Single-stranded DNA-binding protein n=1 Tax=Campylobacter porcelli TaxID=1660073 RepID=A0A1X9SWM0_9BACT|nr:single-stranded DNA-binding protein [Campylobacter sp. RM6137]ARR00586.1 single-stranded DNA binding protein [Campylobacter sp. RM6137]